MENRPNKHLSLLIGLPVLATIWNPLAEPARAEQQDPYVLDFRYAPPWWQTSICLPDDWQKTLVGKDGSLLYDFPGKHKQFKTKITASLAEPTEWVRQELLSPRVPIVRTTKRSGPVEIVESAFAIAPPLIPDEEATTGQVVVERLGDKTGLAGWAKPGGASDPAFANIAVGWNQPIRYRFRAEEDLRYIAVLGLCEGYHPKAGQRILDLSVEGAARKTIDPVAHSGQNRPALFRFDARDENGDGWITVTVSPADGSPDRNPILNVLWVFKHPTDPAMPELVAGHSSHRPLAHVDCGNEATTMGAPRNDILITRLRNTGTSDTRITPTITIESQYGISYTKDAGAVLIGENTRLTCAQPITHVERSPGKLVLQFGPIDISAGKEHVLAIGVARGSRAKCVPQSVAEAEAFMKKAEGYWHDVDLPYDHILVPDAGVQALIDSAIRNIYQAREIKKGLPAFQVGPTCYRGLWVVDGSFLMEAVAFLNRAEEARNGILYLLGFQRDDGAIMIINGHWKETGIALWAVTRHARLTNDKQWLRQQWPKLERGFAYIRKMRQIASANPNAPNAGLIPVGFSDGGLSGKHPEYTNVYWTLAGLRAAVDAARWIGNARQADEWQREYDDFYETFRKAADRDMKTDPSGNAFLPIRMVDKENVAPQKAQWAFLHAIFPGKVFASDDPLVVGNMAMLQAVEDEGLVFGTGWLSKGIWNYFGSFYAHAWLWLGDGQKAARTLYAFGNHASPLLCWREEQSPVGKGTEICGDMPHNWASAEFIRLVRDLLVLKRGNELHLLEGLPWRWVRPGAVTELRDVLTEFGPISLKLQVSDDGKTADLEIDPPSRNRPERIILHRNGWSATNDPLDLPTTGPIQREIALAPLSSR